MILRSGSMMNTDEEKRRHILAAAIPGDLLISEVLVRLPGKSIARCRCVCRSWRAAIAFVRRHRDLSRARPPSSVLVIPREFDHIGYRPRQATTTEISFHRLLLPPSGGHIATEADLMLEKAWPEGITRIIHPTHCDGLVAISTATDRVFVCNPATGEFVALPLGTHNAELDAGELIAVPVAIGFDQWRNSYVVASYFYRMYGNVGEMVLGGDVAGEWSQDYDIGYEVFTLGGGSWELTEDPPHAIGTQRPICTRRAFYWHSDVPEPRLMRFDLQDRVFKVVPHPPTGGWRPFDDMADLDGKLCYIHAVADASFHVWMAAADDGSDDLHWSLRCCIHLPDSVPKRPYIFLPLLVVADDDGDTLVTCAGDTLYKCNLQKGRTEEVVDMQQQLQLQYSRSDGSKYKCRLYHSLICIAPYFETLVSPTSCNY